MTTSPASTYTGRPAICGAWFYVPYEAFSSDASRRAEMRKLTHTNVDRSKIFMFKDMPQQGYLGMPRAYGMTRFPWLSFKDDRSDGVPMSADAAHYRLADPNHSSVKEPARQAKFMADLDHAFATEFHFLAEATTGSGKTPVSINSAIKRGRRTGVIMPLEKLLVQWRNSLINIFGVPEHRIGIVQSDTCVFEDCDFVLMMPKSLGNRRYHPDLYKSIGTLIGDEVHTQATPEQAMVTTQFPARVRCGLSATHEKSDGSDKVLFWHFGPKKVISQATALQCDIYVKDYDDGGRMAAIPPLVQRKGEPPVNNHGYRIKALTRDERRNRMLAEMIFRLWRKGHKVFCPGEHIAHVQHIMELCVQIGIPREVLGQCTGERVIPGKLLRVVNGKPKFSPEKRVKIEQAEWEHAKETADVVFATYGSFKMGVDEPRLDAIVPLTPQGKDKQLRGRVRRPFAGKTRALYVCVRDRGDWMSERYFEIKSREWSMDQTCTVHYGKI